MISADTRFLLMVCTYKGTVMNKALYVSRKWIKLNQCSVRYQLSTKFPLHDTAFVPSLRSRAEFILIHRCNDTLASTIRVPYPMSVS